jgi:hypothetical protein
MTHDTEAYAESTGFPILCADIYHFGGPRSPNIPNPAASSQASYRGAVNALVRLALTHGKTPWVMPQAFTEFWGASWHDEKEHLVLEPGGYWHWRMPTVAEMHWQTWEAVRAGCRGVLYFSILLDSPDKWKPAQGEIPEKEKKTIADNQAAGRPQIKERLFTHDVASLLLPGGRPTPQSRAMGEDFAALEKLESLVATWTPATFPMAFADAPFAVSTFEVRATPGTRYAVVVNDDLQQARTGTVSLLPNVARATNLSTREPLPLRTDPVGSEAFAQTELTLEPGQGCVLELQCGNTAPGLLLFAEQFAGSQLAATLENAERRNERAGFSMGWLWTVRKSGTPDTTALVKLSNLQGPALRANPFAGALRPAAAGSSAVFLQAEGSFPKAESLVVIGVDANGKSTWLQSNNYAFPVRIPAGTTAVHLQLSADAALRGIRAWQVPLPPKPDAR